MSERRNGKLPAVRLTDTQVLRTFRGGVGGVEKVERGE